MMGINEKARKLMSKNINSKRCKENGQRAKPGLMEKKIGIPFCQFLTAHLHDCSLISTPPSRPDYLTLTHHRPPTLTTTHLHSSILPPLSRSSPPQPVISLIFAPLTSLVKK